jgi:hypothetical protein
MGAEGSLCQEAQKQGTKHGTVSRVQSGIPRRSNRMVNLSSEGHCFMLYFLV